MPTSTGSPETPALASSGTSRSLTQTIGRSRPGVLPRRAGLPDLRADRYEFTGNQAIPDGTTAVFHLDGQAHAVGISALRTRQRRPGPPDRGGSPASSASSMSWPAGPRSTRSSHRPKLPEQPSPTHLTTGPGASTPDTFKMPTATSARSSGTSRSTPPHPKRLPPRTGHRPGKPGQRPDTELAAMRSLAARTAQSLSW
jgi:hypothetical protein